MKAEPEQIPMKSFLLILVAGILILAVISALEPVLKNPSGKFEISLTLFYDAFDEHLKNLVGGGEGESYPIGAPYSPPSDTPEDVRTPGIGGEGFDNTDYACPNDVCERELGENFQNCPADCHCGNSVCEGKKINLGSGCTGYYEGESFLNCPDDCQAYDCGDGFCESGLGEDCTNCAEDCHSCGNGQCEPPSENLDTCIADCQMTCYSDDSCKAAASQDNAVNWFCHPRKKICENRQCDTAAAQPATGRLMELEAGGRLTLHGDSASLPGSGPSYNLDDIMNSRCPKVERYVDTLTGCDGSSSGSAVLADYKEYSYEPQNMFTSCAAASLQGLVNIAEAPEFKNIYVYELYGGNHRCPQHRRFQATDLASFILSSGIFVDPETSSANMLCYVARIIKNRSNPSGILGPARAAAVCPDVISTDIGHEDHLHVEWTGC